MSFKELSVMIRNIIDFGFILNAYWVNEANKSLILQRALSDILTLDEHNEFLSKIYSLSPDRRKGKIIMTLAQNGIVLEKVNDKEKSEEEIIIDNYLSRLPRRTI